MLLKAPAKVNLYLEVIRKRPDGYHDIETVFQRIKLYDDIYLEKEKNGLTVDCDCASIREEDNLVYKAAKLLSAESGCRAGARIKLVKKIPVASGLGGGSSDAAYTLIGLNQIWGLGWDKNKLSEAGKMLGADVPFFIYETGTAVGRGRGDEIEPLEGNVAGWLVLVTFPFHVSTKEVYQELKITLTKPPRGVKLLIDLLKGNDPGKLERTLYNSLEQITIKKYPVILEIKDRLKKAGAGGVLMSGSGPSVFGVFREEGKAEAARRQISIKGCNVNLVETG